MVLQRYLIVDVIASEFLKPEAIAVQAMEGGMASGWEKHNF